jgi:hypothetical protein
MHNNPFNLQFYDPQKLSTTGGIFDAPPFIVLLHHYQSGVIRSRKSPRGNFYLGHRPLFFTTPKPHGVLFPNLEHDFVPPRNCIPGNPDTCLCINSVGW